MVKFSEFYGPERQRELLSEAEDRRLADLAGMATANRQSSLTGPKGKNKMFKKIVMALVIVGSLALGYTSLARASHNCSSDSTFLAANPELDVACRYHDLVAGTDSGLSPATEADDTRQNDLADSTSLAANPELKLVQRSIPEDEVDPDRDIGLLEFFTGSNEPASQPVTIDLEALRDYYAKEWTIEADTLDPSPLAQPVSMSDTELLAANPELMLVRRYRIGPLEDVSSHADPSERTANELARQLNYVRQAEPEQATLPAAILIVNPGPLVAECVAIVEQWNRFYHPGR